MKRGEVWTAAGGQAYAGKPRPVVILQDDRFDATDSITVCPLTSDPTSARLFRVRIEPGAANGLRQPSFVMTDKIVPVPRARIRDRIGRLDDPDVARLNRAVLVFLGLAG
ncbi:MAG: type II toxin-antitoxin system PemK/MazF family toxin [Acidobacteriia bacterium]|nr:type II toxin-antitoxin system PemK/MazF family toxin [Terriglobia bacterium]